MPKNKFQEVIFTILMVIVMVYAMICYNIALNTGSMQNRVFLSALRELVIMGPVGFLLDFFLVSRIAGKGAGRVVNVKSAHPFHFVLAFSAISVACMCPMMSLVAVVLFKNAGSQFVSVWLQTTVFNFPMAFFWQIFYAGPLVRFIFRILFRKSGQQC